MSQQHTTLTELQQHGEQSFETLLSLISDPKSNAQLEALKALLTIIQSNPLHFVDLMERQHKRAITNIVNLIQHKDEKLVRLALTCLIAITAASHHNKPTSSGKSLSENSTTKNSTTQNSATENHVGNEKKFAIDDLEQKAHEGAVKLMLLDKVIDKLMNLLIVYDNQLRNVSQKLTNHAQNRNLSTSQELELRHERHKLDSLMELICILLANITTIENGVSRFLQLKSLDYTLDQIKKSALDSDNEEDEEEESDEDSDDEDWAQGYHFKKLLQMFLSQAPIYTPWELMNGDDEHLKCTRWIANIFTNLSTVPSGRMLFLKEKEPDNDTNFSVETGVRMAIQHLFPYVRDEDIIKRRGVLTTIRNCMFFKEKHYLLRQTPLLNILLNRLSTMDVETYNENLDTLFDKKKNPIFKLKEVEPHLRRAITDCIVMFTATLAGMDQMSTESVYQMIESELKEEQDEKVKSNLNTIVQRLNNRMNKKHSDDGGQLVRIEYVSDDEEGEEGTCEGDNNENNAPENLTQEDNNEVNSLD